MLSAIILHSVLTMSQAAPPAPPHAQRGIQPPTLPEVGDTAFWGNMTPEERDRLCLSREQISVNRETLNRLSGPELEHAVDSLRVLADTRRSTVLQQLTPEQRERLERRLQELDRRNEAKFRPSAPPPLRP